MNDFFREIDFFCKVDFIEKNNDFFREIDFTEISRKNPKYTTKHIWNISLFLLFLQVVRADLDNVQW